MSGAPAGHRPTPFAAALRAWWHPAAAIAWAVCLGLIALFAIGSRYDEEFAAHRLEFTLLLYIDGVFFAGCAGGVLGAMAKVHLCRPAGRLAPGWRRAHGLVAGSLLAIQIAAVTIVLATAGFDAFVALVVIASASLLGALAPFHGLGAITFLVAGFGWCVPLHLPAYRRVAIEALTGGHPLTMAAILLGALALAALGLRRAAALDEDDAFYHLSLPPKGGVIAEALRHSGLMRAIRRWDASAPEVAGATLSPTTWAWARHRHPLLGIAWPWPIALAGAVGFVACFAAALGPRRAIDLGMAMMVLATLTSPMLILQPGFAAGRGLESLRPGSTRRNHASLVLAMLLRQAAGVGIFAVATVVVLVACDQRAAWGQVALALVLAAAAAPLAATLLVTAVTIRAPSRRYLVVGLAGFVAFAGVIHLQAFGLPPGWIYAALLVTGLTAAPCAWHRLIRIDID